jgi:hypothetical protein
MKRLFLTMIGLIMGMVMMAGDWDTLYFKTGDHVVVELKADDEALTGGVLPTWYYGSTALAPYMTVFGGKDYIDVVATAGMVDDYVYYTFDITGGGVTVTHYDTIAFIHFYAAPAITGVTVNGHGGIYVREGDTVRVKIAVSEGLDVAQTKLISEDGVIWNGVDTEFAFVPDWLGEKEVQAVATNTLASDTSEVKLISVYPHFEVSGIGYTLTKGYKEMKEFVDVDTIEVSAADGWRVELMTQTNGALIAEYSNSLEWISYNWMRDGESVKSGGWLNAQTFVIEDFGKADVGLYAVYMVGDEGTVVRYYNIVRAGVSAKEAVEGVRVFASGNAINVTGNVGNLRTDIYNIAGALIWTGAGDAVVAVAKGVYVVRVGGKVVKVVN